MELIIVKRLMKELYLYDKSTYYHSFNVALISNEIANSMKLGNYSEKINIGCALHDIGKINMNKKLLDQTKIYNKSEYKMMKEHVILGYDLIKKSLDNNDFIIRDIVLQHHERLNGSGYPNGLLGNEINVFAKICAVADTYNAIKSRDYNKDKNVIYELIKGVEDNLFDEEIVNILISLINKGKI